MLKLKIILKIKLMIIKNNSLEIIRKNKYSQKELKIHLVNHIKL